MPEKPLQVLVDFVRANSPYFAQLYRDVPPTIRRLSELPIIDQAAYWAANRWPDNQVLTGPLTDAGIYKTGGTTGAPKLSPWTRSEHEDAVSTVGVGLVQAGLRPGHRVANLFHSGELYGGLLFLEHALHRAPVENVRLTLGTAATDDYVAEVVGALGVTVLAGEPMKLSSLAEYFLRQGQVLESMELLIFAGDLMFDDLRPILHRAFPNAPIVSMGLSSNDAGLIAAPVPGADVRAHEAFANRTIIEIVEESTGEPITEPGRVGRLLVTNLFRTLMPIIRYPCGDRAEWVDPARQRFRLVGRAQEGARVSYVNMLIEDTRAVLIEADPGRHMVGMQMVVRRYDGRDELTLRLGYVEPPPPQLSEQLIAAVYRRRPEFAKEVDIDSAHPLRIEWVPRADLQTHPLTGKLQQVIDDRLQG